MLIYNHNKELVGIDDETLHHLGYKTLAGFFQDYRDVAELFVKKPGYIHNFQNFPWIDFVLHAEAEDTKAIIQNEKKHFSCNISITPVYLSDMPDQEAYLVHLKHIKALTVELETFERRSVSEEEPAMFADSGFGLPMDDEPESEPTVLSEPDTFDIPDAPMIDLPNLNPDGSIAEPDMDVFEPVSAPPKAEKPMLGDYINKEEKAYLDNLQTDKDYVYDPHVAADELGLPVELIEEFIGDFIQQAHEFKDGLFDAALKEDFDEVHILSHKLKGVAANLRIEDAFEVLSVVNNSRDQVEIEANLKQFYRIVAKMEGKEVPDFTEMEAEEQFETPLDEHDDDIYDIGMLLETVPEPEKTPAPRVEAEIEPLLPEEPEALEPELEPKVEPEPEIEPTPEAEAETVIEPEPKTEEEVLEPFDMDIIPEEEQHLVKDAKEKEVYKQMSGNIATDADLMAGEDFEPLHYNMKKASAEIGLKEAFIHGLIDDFVSDANAKKKALMAAIDDGDMRTVQSIAFEFKGLADNLRIEQISHTLTKLLRNENTAAVKTEAKRFYAFLNQF